MASHRAFRGFLSSAMLAAVAACSSLPSGPRDLLDEHTGATVTVVGAPLEFVRRPSEQSSPQFLTLVAIRRDDDGKYTQLLLVYRWSVLYGPVASAPEQSVGDLVIDIDGHSMQLQPLPQLPTGLPSPKDLFVPDTTAAAMHAYVIDVDAMRMIATSHELTVTLPQESLSGPYMIWHDGRPALAQFVNQLSAP
jgi:hypothetical protein